MREEQSDRLPYTVVLLERNGAFFAYEPGLSLLASDDSVDGAYRKFAVSRREFFKARDLAGLADGAAASALPEKTRAAAPLAGSHTQVTLDRSIAGELGLFLGKLCILLLVLGGIGAGAAVALAGLAPQGGISMTDIADKAADIVKDLHLMSPDQKEAFRQNIGIISRELAPIADAWRNPPPVSSPGTK